MDLTEQHLALLRAAAEEPDGLLHCPGKLVGAVRRRMADRLLGAGVVEAVAAEHGQPHWFRSEEGVLTALRLTASGRALARIETTPVDGHPSHSIVLAPTGQGRAHRPGTKRALLLDLLGRGGGVTLAVLTRSTGWQSHTVRAALTRLRQDGVTIHRGSGEGGTTYRIAENGQADASVDVGAVA